MSGLPLERTSVPGVYRRGSRFVAVYRRGGRQRKETVGTLAEARALKLARSAEARAARRGPTLHDYALGWLDRYGHLIDGEIGLALDLRAEVRCQLRRRCSRPNSDELCELITIAVISCYKLS